MKLTTDNTHFDGHLPENRVPVTIQSTQQLFGILSDSIYSNKILAVIRELCCNAYDAHIAAKNPEPFIVNLPTDLNPEFSVSDNGTGIHPDKMGDIFWTYGKSTKTNTNEQIGALGLGAKSPFAYTKSSYIVKNRWNGVEYTYVCFIGDNGIPNATVLDESSTNEPNGITVELAVASSDVKAFKKQAEEFFSWWDKNKLPKFNIDLNIPEFISLTKFRGKRWAFANYQTTSYVLMGNIAYTVNSRYIPNISKKLSKMLNLDVVIFADIGDVDFQPSREALAFSEKTIAFLEKFAIKFWEEVLDHFKTDIDEMKRSVPIVAFQRMALINSACNRALNMRIDNELFGNIDYFYNGNEINLTDSYYYELSIEGYSPIALKSFGVNRSSYSSERTFNLITEVKTSHGRNQPWQKPDVNDPTIPQNKSTRLYKNMCRVDDKGNVVKIKNVESTEFCLPKLYANDTIDDSPVVFYVNDKLKESGVATELAEYLKTKHDGRSNVLVSLSDKAFLNSYPDYGVQFIETLIRGTIYEGCKIVLVSDVIKTIKAPIVKKPRSKKHNLELPVLNIKFNTGINKNVTHDSYATQILKQRIQVDESEEYYIPYIKLGINSGYYTETTIIEMLNIAANLNLIDTNKTHQFALLSKLAYEDIILKRGSKMVNFIDHFIERFKAVVPEECIVYDYIVNRYSTLHSATLRKMFNTFIKSGKVDVTAEPFKYFVTDYEANPKLNQYTIINRCLTYFSHSHFIKKEILDEKYNSVEKFLNKQPCLYALVYSGYNVPQQIEKIMFDDMIRVVLNYVDNV